jgi:hypothetical protein
VSVVELRLAGEQADWRLARFVVMQPVASEDDHQPAPPPEPHDVDVDAGPMLDPDGLLRFRGNWVAVPDAQVAVVQLLVDRFQHTVPDDDLLAVFACDGHDDATRKLAGALHRLRGRVKECNLALSRVRARGYILDHAHASVRSCSDEGCSPSGSATNL